MVQRHDGLFDGIAGFRPLLMAARTAAKGKRAKAAPAAFLANLERQVLRLERELNDRSWKPGGYVTIAIKDPKPRMVSAAPFRDRVVHHALCAVVQPLFERGFIDDSYQATSSAFLCRARIAATCSGCGSSGFAGRRIARMERRVFARDARAE